MKSDAVDRRIVDNVRNGDYTAQEVTAVCWDLLIGNGCGGWPVYVKENAPVDTDGDGMPDAWEAANGLNPKSSADGVKYNLSKEYTNLEVYINSLVEKLYPAK